MKTTYMNMRDYAKALIRAGLTQELVLKVTAISPYQYKQICREVLAA